MNGKKMWIVPTTEVQKFAANEYVAACTVKFVCDVQGRGDLFTADGTNLTPNKVATTYYRPCSAELEVAADSDFQTGYLVENNGSDQKKNWMGSAYKQIPCIIWTDGDDLHATANTDLSTWDRNHS